MSKLLLLLTLLLLATAVTAANDPGHDSLYVVRLGNSSIIGSLNITSTLNASNVRVAALLYGDQLDIRANGTIQSAASRPAIQADANDLYLDAKSNLYINTQGGTTNTIQIGPATGSSITLNVSGTIRQQNVAVCLSNGTNCLSGNNTGNITTVTNGTGISITGSTGPTVTVTVDATVCRSDGTNCPASGSSSSAGWANNTVSTRTTLQTIVNSSNISGSFLVQNQTGSTHLFVNGTSGYVGVGTNAPVAQLQVNGSSDVSLIKITTNNPNWYMHVGEGGSGVGGVWINQPSPDSVNYILSHTSLVTSLNSPVGGSIVFSINNAAKAGVHSTGGVAIGSSYYPGVGVDPGADNLVVQGKIGIGTTAPLTNFNVNGTANITGATYLGNSLCGAGDFLTTNSATGLISCGTPSASSGLGSGFSGWINTSTRVYLNNNATNLSVGSSSGVPNLYVDNTNGRVGVGTGSPVAQLHVSGAVRQLSVGNASFQQNPFAASSGGIAIQGSYAYVVDGNYTGNLLVFDISNAAQPVLVARVAVGYGPLKVLLQGRYAYIMKQSDSGSFSVYDVSSPASPKSLANTSVNGAAFVYDMALQGQHLYFVDNTGNITTMNVANPLAPIVVNRTAIAVSGAYANGVCVKDDALFLMDANSNFISYNITEPSRPVKMQNITLAVTSTPCTIQGSYAYVAGYWSGMKVINISNPAQMSVVGSTNVDGTFWAVTVQGRYAFAHATSATNSTVVYDISNPASPAYVANITTTGGSRSGAAGSIAVQGRYLYTVGDGGYLQVYDLGGAYIQQLETGGIQTSTLATIGAVQVGTSLEVRGAASIGRGLNVRGESVFVNQQTESFRVLNTTGGTHLFVNGSSGFVGVGTSAPGSLLTVNGTANITGATYLGNSLCGAGDFLTTNSATGLISCSTPSGGSYQASAAGWVNDTTSTRTLLRAFVNSSSGSGSFMVQNTTGSTHLFVNGSSGYVGIGNASPQYPLSVYTTTAYPVAQFYSNWAGINQALGIFMDGSGTILDASSSLIFDIASAPKMMLSSNGNFAVGSITTPAATLQVNSSNGAGNLWVVNTTGSTHLFVNGSSGYVGIGIIGNVSRLTVNDTSGYPQLTLVGGYQGTASSLGGQLSFGDPTVGQVTMAYRYSDDAFNIDVPGTRAINFTNGGYGSIMFLKGGSNFVGIGTTTPTATLHVSSSNAAGSLLIHNTTGSTHLFVNGSSGFVGVGTIAPQSRLHVNTSDSLALYAVAAPAGITLPIATFEATTAYNGDPSIRINFNAKYDSDGTVTDLGAIKVGKENTDNGDYGGFFAIYTRSTAGNDDERLRVTSRGNVGIGTDSPQSVLHVLGNMRVNSSLANGSLIVQNTTGSAHLFVNGSSGRVGIDTRVPSAALDINGTVKINGNTTFALSGTETTVCFERFIGATQNYTRCINASGSVIETVGSFAVN